MEKTPLFLFYEEPDPDRWFPYDRHLRRLVRRLVRGPYQPGGVMRWFLNLRTGLDHLGIPYRLNDYRGLRRYPGATAHVVGKPHVIEKIPAGHPIVYGPGVSAHPFEDTFWDRAEIALILLSCDWFKAMYDQDLSTPIPTAVWPAGVETDLWMPSSNADPRRVLVYDKIRWDRERYEPQLLEPIRQRLSAEGFMVEYLRYGDYVEEDYRNSLKRVSAMIFLCEHETQGFAYLQALSSGVPIFAWDRAGEWQDPSMYPHRVRFGPVSSVPYWDHRCGEKFKNLTEFESRLPLFIRSLSSQSYQPRDYVTENFNLAERARAYLRIATQEGEKVNQ
ncbi:MAG: glycosyltransferase [Synoicihabitans sp.]